MKRSKPVPIPLRRIATDRWLVSLVIVGAALRILYGVTANVPLDIGDQQQYKMIADHFGAWWHSADAVRTPGYPAFLAALGWMGLGDSGVQIVQALGLSGGCYLIALAAARVGGLPAARAAAALGAVYVPLITLPALILPDALAAALLAASFFAMAEGHRDPRSMRWVVMSAVALALGVLVRPNLVIVFPVLLVWWLFVRRGLGARVVAVVAVAVAALLIFSPWVIRNVDVRGSASPLGTSDSSRLIVAGVHLPIDRTGGRYGAYYRSAHFFSNRDLGGPLNVYQATGRNPWPILWANLTERPLEQISASLFWVRELWVVPFDARAQYGLTPVVPYLFLLAIHLAVLALAIAGVWLYRRRAQVRLAAAIAVVMTLPFLILLPEPRYALPITLLLLLPSGLAAGDLVSGASRRLSGDWANRSEHD
jgi:4-amino-4-deoxy-L-arabinose transferase-like glycosyltransferase